MTDMVKSGEVRVNWRVVTRASAVLKEGDVVACQGKGRIEVKSITVTKKERYSVTYMRYV
jgi:RNA-binding protein YlmH